MRAFVVKWVSPFIFARIFRVFDSFTRFSWFLVTSIVFYGKPESWKCTSFTNKSKSHKKIVSFSIFIALSKFEFFRSSRGFSRIPWFLLMMFLNYSDPQSRKCHNFTGESTKSRKVENSFIFSRFFWILKYFSTFSDFEVQNFQNRFGTFFNLVTAPHRSCDGKVSILIKNFL